MEYHRRSKLARLTAVRAYRLQAGLTLAEVALRAGISTFRLSTIERDPSTARAGEIEAHRRAIDELSSQGAA